MNIDEQFLEDAEVPQLSEGALKSYIGQLELIVATVDKVQKEGKRAKLPKDWRYNEPMHELSVAGPVHPVVQRLVKVAITREGISASEIRKATATHNIVLSLKVV